MCSIPPPFFPCPFNKKWHNKERLVQSSSVELRVFTIHPNTGQLVLLMGVLISISTTHTSHLSSTPCPPFLIHVHSDMFLILLPIVVLTVHHIILNIDVLESTFHRITNLIEISSTNMLLSNNALLREISAPHPPLSDLNEVT